ncbi:MULTISPECIES: hypothetical protein [Stenotrophomonas]|uniref:hypothetical protein n=1 Tax=Stenotrophomonas TaxID=40323 RepID=UPI0016612C64|nr:hypothetical protein [Stenotrophomonas maltophilia]
MAIGTICCGELRRTWCSCKLDGDASENGFGNARDEKLSHSAEATMPETILTAATPAELQIKLGQLDTAVPPRSEGRRTDHVERYCVVHLLATIPPEHLSFPLTLVHSDRPDFVLTMPADNVGIEHTEAVPENVAQSMFLREKGLGSAIYFTPRALPGEPRKTFGELRDEILSHDLDDSGQGWEGDSAEREWAAAMAYFVKEKMRKAGAPGFVRYPANWLMVYDNWPLPAIDASQAAGYLAPLLWEAGAFAIFDVVFVLDDSRIWQFPGPLVYSLVKPI